MTQPVHPLAAQRDAAHRRYAAASKKHDQFGTHGTYANGDTRSRAEAEADRLECCAASDAMLEADQLYYAWLIDPANRSHPYNQLLDDMRDEW